MASLVVVKGPQPGRRFPLHESCTDLGRHLSSAVCLESQAVSRHHARILCLEGEYFVEDLESSNGTFINGQRIRGRTPFHENDSLQVGPYSFSLQPLAEAKPVTEDMVIRSQLVAHPSDHGMHGEDPSYKLQVVLEISKHLAKTLDLDELLSKFLDQLMSLFPQTDRAMVLLGQGDRLQLRAMKSREEEDSSTYPYSRTVVKRVLEEGVSVLSEDVVGDERFQGSATIASLNLRSIMCVPLIAQDDTRLGVVQLDRFRVGRSYQNQDLQLLTAVGLQVAVVLQNAAMHAELLREQRLRQELALASEIQQSFLPNDFSAASLCGLELFARVLPAREVAGDLYDFFPLSEDRLAFFVGDVSGKGMPAALFMMAVRILGRHLASAGESPAHTLRLLNGALAADNPSAMFVTLIHGIYYQSTGELVLSSAGHPMPLIRRTDGVVETFNMKVGRLLGYEGGNLGLMDSHLQLQPGETLVLFTDGYIEAKSNDGKTMFGVERLQAALGGERVTLPLEACEQSVRDEVFKFTGSAELQDDLTMLLLRRPS